MLLIINEHLEAHNFLRFIFFLFFFLIWEGNFSTILGSTIIRVITRTHPAKFSKTFQNGCTLTSKDVIYDGKTFRMPHFIQQLDIVVLSIAVKSLILIKWF